MFLICFRFWPNLERHDFGQISALCSYKIVLIKKTCSSMSIKLFCRISNILLFFTSFTSLLHPLLVYVKGINFHSQKFSRFWAQIQWQKISSSKFFVTSSIAKLNSMKFSFVPPDNVSRNMSVGFIVLNVLFRQLYMV